MSKRIGALYLVLMHLIGWALSSDRYEKKWRGAEMRVFAYAVIYGKKDPTMSARANRQWDTYRVWL